MKTLPTKERDAVIHAMNVAAMRFREDVRTWQEVKPSGFVTAGAIPRMIELFTGYAEAAEALHAKLQFAREIAFDDGEDESGVR